MTNQHEVVNGYENSIRVVYLIGAGASHACVDMLGSSHGILMEHLTQEIAECVREKGMCPEVRGKRTAPSTPSSERHIRRQPPRVREPRSDVGSRRCVVVESGQRR